MIRMIRNEGRTTPIVVCDNCKEPITDSEMAMAIWKQPDVDGTQAEVFHLHKGPCDRAFKAVIGDPNPWQELTKHLHYLCSNVGLSPEKLLKEEAIEQEIGTL